MFRATQKCYVFTRHLVATAVTASRTDINNRTDGHLHTKISAKCSNTLKCKKVTANKSYVYNVVADCSGRNVNVM